MKSIVHEASSIAKAIEQGWIKAGKPRDFSIRIYEEPKKNFFGFTVQSAKIGIVVDDHTQSRNRRSRYYTNQYQRRRADYRRRQHYNKPGMSRSSYEQSKSDGYQSKPSSDSRSSHSGDTRNWSKPTDKK